MVEVRFYNHETVNGYKLKFVVIMAMYRDKWIMVRQKARNTWEIPGGHIEVNEAPYEAAKRELFEETGALDFELCSVGVYSVSIENGVGSFGQLFFAKINQLGELPDSEIEERKYVDSIEGDLTYPEIQPILAKAVIGYIEKRNL